MVSDAMHPTNPYDAKTALARRTKGRLPDTFYQVPREGQNAIRLDVVALGEIEEFLLATEEMRASDDFRAISSKYRGVFEEVQSIFQLTQTGQTIELSEIEKVKVEYRTFLNEIKVLFENFKNTVPEEI